MIINDNDYRTFANMSYDEWQRFRNMCADVASAQDLIDDLDGRISDLISKKQDVLDRAHEAMEQINLMR